MKSRGVTRYTDLIIKNKRSLDDVDSDDEVMDDDNDSDDGQPPRQRRRLVDPAFQGSPAPSLSYEPSILNEAIPNPEIDNSAAGLPELASDSPGLLSQGQPGLETSDGPDHRMDPGLSDPAPPGLEEPGPQQQTLNPPNLAVDIPISVGEPSREPSPAQANRSTPHSMPPPATLPSSTATTSMPQLDSITASYYQPATAEDFRAHRRRVQQQETMSFGPFRARRDASEAEPTGPAHGTSPYTRPTTDDDAAFAFSAMDVEDLDSSALPPGWKFEDGYIVLTEQPKDYWEVAA